MISNLSPPEMIDRHDITDKKDMNETLISYSHKIHLTFYISQTFLPCEQ